MKTNNIYELKRMLNSALKSRIVVRMAKLVLRCTRQGMRV